MQQNLHHPSKFVSSALLLKEQLLGKSHTIVFTNGCFDLFHDGHIYLLEACKKLGDIVIVGINTDASVKRLKGETRPIENLATRISHLAQLNTVDYILAFDEDTPLQLIETLLPNFLVKGGDYTLEQIVGAQTVIEHKGRVVIIPTLKGFSTTKKIENK